MTLRNEKSDRQRRAIRAVLKDHTGPPLLVKQIIKLAAALGPDEPTIRPVLYKMVKQGELVIAAPNLHQQGVRFRDMPIALAPLPPTPTTKPCPNPPPSRNR
jgi:hypothetical protein